VTGKLIRIGAAVLVATAILATLIVLVPRRQSLFVGIYELVLATIAIGTVVGSFRTFEPEAWMHSPFEREPEKPEQPQPIAELDRIDRLVVLGAANEFDFHYRLRPVLRQIAAERLHGAFTRQLFLGETLDAERLVASYETGVLTLRIPVAESAKPRKVPITEGADGRTIEAQTSPVST